MCTTVFLKINTMYRLFRKNILFFLLILHFWLQMWGKGEGSPHQIIPPPSCGHQMGIQPLNSILTSSTWRGHQIPQVRDSVSQDCPLQRPIARQGGTEGGTLCFWKIPLSPGSYMGFRSPLSGTRVKDQILEPRGETHTYTYYFTQVRNSSWTNICWMKERIVPTDPKEAFPIVLEYFLKIF